MTNSAYPDQNAATGESDLGLHCLLWQICPKNLDNYSKTEVNLLDSVVNIFQFSLSIIKLVSGFISSCRKEDYNRTVDIIRIVGKKNLS